MIFGIVVYEFCDCAETSVKEGDIGLDCENIFIYDSEMTVLVTNLSMESLWDHYGITMKSR